MMVRMAVIHIENKEHLQKTIKRYLAQKGSSCSLNHLDVSKITDMSQLFTKEYGIFNGDISEWDVSNVTTMAGMFNGSLFKGNISRWDVSHVTDMSGMFARSFFNGSLAAWNVSRVKDMGSMFASSMFQGDISRWRVGRVRNMSRMFAQSMFRGDLHRWKISKYTDIQRMFLDTSFEGYLPPLKRENLLSLQLFNRFHPSIEGFMYVLDGQSEVPNTYEHREAFQYARGIAEGLKMPIEQAAQYIHHRLYGVTDQDSSIDLSLDEEHPLFEVL